MNLAVHICIRDNRKKLFSKSMHYNHNFFLLKEPSKVVQI
jgi:hypothetical protein